MEKGSTQVTTLSKFPGAELKGKERKIFLGSGLLVAMSEDQQVTIEFQKFGSPECKALMGESQISKALGFGSRISLATALPIYFCHCFALVSGMVSMGVGVPTAFNVV